MRTIVQNELIMKIKLLVGEIHTNVCLMTDMISFSGHKFVIKVQYMCGNCSSLSAVFRF